MTAREQAYEKAKAAARLRAQAAVAKSKAAIAARNAAAAAAGGGQPTPGAMVPGTSMGLGAQLAALSMPMKLLLGAGVIGAAVVVVRTIKK